MTKLLNFTKTQEKRRKEKRGGFFCVFGMKEMGGLYNSGGGNMNGRPFNKG